MENSVSFLQSVKAAVLATLFSVALFGERLTLLSTAGILLILGAIVMIGKTEKD